MKKTSKIKRIATIGLIFLISINSFATSLSDNDGSAFITKAEFDALKSSFQAQIDTYNQGIDSKIDSAIATYLSGINISYEPINYYQKVKNSVGEDIWFKNEFANTGTATIKTALNYNLIRHYTYLYWNNIAWSIKIYQGWNTPPNSVLFGTMLSLGWPAGDPDNISRLLYSETGFENNAQDKHMYYDNPSTWAIKDNRSSHWNYGTTGYNNISSSTADSIEGEGAAWIYEVKPSGRLILRQWASSVYPRMDIDMVSHTYLSKKTTTLATFETYYCQPNGLGDTQDLGTIAVPKLSTWGSTESGTKILDNDNTTAKAQWYKVITSLDKSIDGKDYSIYMWGDGITNIYCQNTSVQPNVDASTTAVDASKTESSFREAYYAANSILMSENKLSGQKFTYYPISINNENKNAGQFANEYVSSVVGEDVMINEGIPIAEIVDDEQKIKLSLKFKSSTNSGSVKYKISDKKFVNNNFDSSANVKISDTVAVGTDKENILNINNKCTLWLTCCSTTSGVDAAIKEFSVSKINN